MADGCQEFSAVSVFEDIPVSACLQGGQNILLRAVDRQNDDLGGSVYSLDFLDGFETGHFRHGKIQ